MVQGSSKLARKHQSARKHATQPKKGRRDIPPKNPLAKQSAKIKRVRISDPALLPLTLYLGPVCQNHKLHRAADGRCRLQGQTHHHEARGQAKLIVRLGAITSTGRHGSMGIPASPIPCGIIGFAGIVQLQIITSFFEIL